MNWRLKIFQGQMKKKKEPIHANEGRKNWIEWKRWAITSIAKNFFLSCDLRGIRHQLQSISCIIEESFHFDQFIFYASSPRKATHIVWVTCTHAYLLEIRCEQKRTHSTLIVYQKKINSCFWMLQTPSIHRLDYNNENGHGVVMLHRIFHSEIILSWYNNITKVSTLHFKYLQNQSRKVLHVNRLRNK